MIDGEQARSWTLFSVFAIAITFGSALGQAADVMPAAEEDATVQKYCGGCHSDALRYGGLSVQHFDAAHPDPTVAIMLLSKITNGRTPKDVAAADSAAIRKMMQASAMGAAGKGVPDDQTQVAFATSLAQQSKGAYEWSVSWEYAGANDRTLIASIVKERPAKPELQGVTDSYRLILRCRPDTRKGEIDVAWANAAPKEGQLMSVAVDDAAPFQHAVNGGRAQGNGNGGPGSTALKIPLPMQRLTISNLFSEGNVVFPFGDLDQAARRELSVCFTADQAVY